MTSALSISFMVGGIEGLHGTASGWPGGSRPRPLTDITVGASSFSASARTNGPASCAPPPSSSTGALALFSQSAAFCSAAGEAAGGDGGTTARIGGSLSAAAVMMSSGSSIWTGRGRPPANTAKARATTLGSSAGVITVWLKALTCFTSWRWSCNSCSQPSPEPIWPSALTAEITSMGIELA